MFFQNRDVKPLLLFGRYMAADFFGVKPVSNFGEQGNILPLPKIEIRFFGRPARSLVIMSNSLPWFRL
jgi:hypothetical protein